MRHKKFIKIINRLDSLHVHNLQYSLYRSQRLHLEPQRFCYVRLKVLSVLTLTHKKEMSTKSKDEEKKQTTNNNHSSSSCFSSIFIFISSSCLLFRLLLRVECFESWLLWLLQSLVINRVVRVVFFVFHLKFMRFILF